MAPKTPPQKTVDYENDSFEVWLQKTNVISSEQGDLNTLHPEIYSPNPLNPDFKPIRGLAYAEVSPFLTGTAPHKLLGLDTEFAKDLNIGDLIGLELLPPGPTPIDVHPYSTDLFRWIVSTSSQVTQCNVFREQNLRSPVGQTPLRMHVIGNDPHILTYGLPKFNLAPTTTNDVWNVSVYVRANQLTSCQLFAFEVNANGTQHPSGGVYAQTFVVTTEWQLISMNVTVTNPNSKFIQVRLDGPQTNGIGHTLWFDGLQVKKLLAQDNFFPHPQNIGFWARNATVLRGSILIDSTVTSPVGTTPLKLTATANNALLQTLSDTRVEYSVAPVEVGETWECSVLVKAQTLGQKAVLSVGLADSSHVALATVESSLVTINQEWQKISLEITVTDPLAAFLKVSLGAETSGSIFWFDDLRVVKKVPEIEPLWGDRSTYLLKVTSIVDNNQVLVEPKYAGPTPYPPFPTTSSLAKPIFVKQVNLIDSVNSLYNNAVLGLRRILIRSIGMS